jgi:hypothetical protein
VENALLAAQAQLPALVREVANARAVIAENTAPPRNGDGEETSEG